MLTIPSRASTFGALFFGSTFSLIMYGWGLLQTFRYFRMYPQDKTLIKAWVVILMFFESLATAFMLHICYIYFVIEGYGDAVWTENIWSSNFIPLCEIGAIVATQSFYVRRIYYLGHHRLIVTGTSILVALELVITIVGCIMLQSWGVDSDTASNSSILEYGPNVACGIVFVVDFILTTTLLYNLRRARRNGFSSTNLMLDTLITYTVSTGLLTSVFAVASFIFLWTNPEDLIWFSFTLLGTKMYSISFLTMLNSRRSIGSRANLVDSFENGNIHARAEATSHHQVQSSIFVAAIPQTTATSMSTLDTKANGHEVLQV
ncbi:hypothetical protein C8Q80DRAFT_911038 [Daedaleopsis nitida]|nr:hypothetical protein C8Q80DRAFT_911038 [Daedaleopsis nitida]